MVCFSFLDGSFWNSTVARPGVRQDGQGVSHDQSFGEMMFNESMTP